LQDWTEFCELFAFITQVAEEYSQLQRYDTPHDYTQRGRTTAHKVGRMFSGVLANLPAHYVRCMLESMVPDCANNSPDDAREIPLSSYLRFRSEFFMIHKVFDRLPKDEEMQTNAVLSRDMLVSLFCACAARRPPPACQLPQTPSPLPSLSSHLPLHAHTLPHNTHAFLYLKSTCAPNPF
jgi:hypothetical protein